MPVPHATEIATKGLLSGNATNLASKGYIHIRIEVIPVPPKKKGGSSGKMTEKFGKEDKKTKIIKVIVTYKNVKYVEAKEVDIDAKVTTDDVDVKLGEFPEITINVEGVKLNKKDIEKLGE